MNKVFQYFWYYIGKSFTRRKKSKNTGILLDDYSDRMVSQLKWAERFGEVDLVIFGDSNGEELADYQSMKQFPKLAINFSIGGTRADHWSQFLLASQVGKTITDKIKGKKILINVGGNNVLQEQMHTLPSALVNLNHAFPNAYWINIPRIYSDIIANLKGQDVTVIQKDIKDANLMIADVAGDRLIDIRGFTGLDGGAPYFGVLKDAVHYSDFFDKVIRIPLIKAKLYGL